MKKDIYINIINKILMVKYTFSILFIPNSQCNLYNKLKQFIALDNQGLPHVDENLILLTLYNILQRMQGLVIN